MNDVVEVDVERNEGVKHNDDWSAVGLSDDDERLLGKNAAARNVIVVLQTEFNEVGHADDNLDHSLGGLKALKETVQRVVSSRQPEEQKEPDDGKQLPMVIFRAMKTFVLDADKAGRVATQAELLKGKKVVGFPSKRLLDAFSQVLVKAIDPGADVDVTKPDVLSVLTAAVMLKNDEVILKCADALHADHLSLSEFPRALKLVAKFSEHGSFVDALFLFGLRHAKKLVVLHPLLDNWESESIFDQSAVRIKTRFMNLFLPLQPVSVIEEPINIEEPKGKRKGYPHLEKHRFERISVAGSEDKHFVLIRERDNAFICAAKLNDAKNAFLFFSGTEYPCDMKCANVESYCGTVKSNLLGDAWVLYDAAGKLRRTSWGQVKYAQNALGRVPNAMTVILPDGFTLRTRKPKWTEERGYSLDFRGRVVIASKKNFILLNSGDDVGPDDSIVMLFGKFTKNVFNLDLAPPMSPLLGFAVALTTFADKLIVT